METSDTVLRLGRAVDALRRGAGVRVPFNGHTHALFATEFLEESLFNRVGAQAHFLFARSRAESLGLAASSGALSVPAAALSYAQARYIADPTLPEEPLPALAPEAAEPYLLQLVKYASLLPSVLLFPAGQEEAEWPEVMLSDISGYATSPLPPVVETAAARLPIEGAEQCRIQSFRALYATSTHLLLTIGDQQANAQPLVRVHSSCITGDILGSLRCDCGDQLKLALDAIKAQGSGMLIYLHQEGRGIGITNKIRAYRLQERGYDTYEANRLLGYEEDERDFAIAAAILKQAGFSSVRLLSNNPSKLEKLSAHGITVSERVPLVVPVGAHNHGYLDAKAKKAGHLF